METPDPIPDSDVTPPELFFNRRVFLQAGIAIAGVAATGLMYRRLNRAGDSDVQTAAFDQRVIPATGPAAEESGYYVGETPTPLKNVANYNNYYEFSTDKESVAPATVGFKSKPWKIEVGGLCGKPKTFDLDDLFKLSPPEERVYRMRCVEAWSMVIPWAGYSLSKLIEQVEPNSAAKFVAFETLNDPARMPGLGSGGLDWPYVEGLRMDEAMHPLTLLATGLYGRELPVQNGAPVRLVIPWKYGFKGIKSIVKITLVSEQPPTTWNKANPSEYGFYANVNPRVDHPRWTQATERRIGEVMPRPTLMFNGYAKQVGHLYEGMDLTRNY